MTDQGEQLRHWEARAAIAAALIAGVSLWLTYDLQQETIAQQRRSLRKQQDAVDQQMRMFFLQNAADLRETMCTPAGKDVMTDSDLNENPMTPKEVDEACAEAEKEPPSFDVRRELVSLLAANPSQQAGIISAYHQIYGEGATWIDELAQAL